jgi:hypothetical protein
MTQEEFIEILKEEGYSYEIEGDRIVVTYGGLVDLRDITSLPPGVEFKNGEDVWLDGLISLPPGVKFENEGYVYLYALKSLPSGVEFSNGGRVLLNALTSLPSDVKFRNEGDVDLDALRSLPPGVEFRNGGEVYLRSLIGDRFYEWEGNIEGIGSNRLLNVMIKQGVFER